MDIPVRHSSPVTLRDVRGKDEVAGEQQHQQGEVVQHQQITVTDPPHHIKVKSYSF